MNTTTKATITAEDGLKQMMRLEKKLIEAIREKVDSVLPTGTGRRFISVDKDKAENCIEGGGGIQDPISMVHLERSGGKLTLYVTTREMGTVNIKQGYNLPLI